MHQSKYRAGCNFYQIGSVGGPHKLVLEMYDAGQSIGRKEVQHLNRNPKPPRRDQATRVTFDSVCKSLTRSRAIDLEWV